MNGDRINCMTKFNNKLKIEGEDKGRRFSFANQSVYVFSLNDDYSIKISDIAFNVGLGDLREEIDSFSNLSKIVTGQYGFLVNGKKIGIIEERVVHVWTLITVKAKIQIYPIENRDGIDDQIVTTKHGSDEEDGKLKIGKKECSDVQEGQERIGSV